MIEVVAPSTAYSSRMVGFATGQVGTIRFRLVDNDSTADDPIYGPSTADIIEDPTGSGSYLFRGTAPATQSKYARLWDLGVGTTVSSDDDLYVSYTATVPSGTPAGEFIAVSDLVFYLGRAVEADKAAFAVTSACAVVRQQIGQDLDYVEDDSVLLSGEGGPSLLLPEMPVYSVTSVTDSDDYLLVDDTDYVVDLREGLIRAKSTTTFFTRGRHNYTVVYTHGYVDDDSVSGLPADVQEWPYAIKLVALHLAARIYDQGLVKTETVGAYTSSYSSDEAPVLTNREISLLELAIGVGRRQ